MICSVYYDFIPHALLAGLTPSSLALFSHKSFPSEFPCTLPAVEQLGRYRKTRTAPKGCSQGHGLAVEPGFSWSSLDDGLHHPISSSGGDVLRSCGLQTRSLLFACLSNPASLKAEMFSLPQRRSRECWLFLGKQACSQETGLSIPKPRFSIPMPLVFLPLNLQAKEVWLSGVFSPQEASPADSHLCCICSGGHDVLDLNKL